MKRFSKMDYHQLLDESFRISDKAIAENAKVEQTERVILLLSEVESMANPRDKDTINWVRKEVKNLLYAARKRKVRACENLTAVSEALKEKRK